MEAIASNLCIAYTAVSGTLPLTMENVVRVKKYNSIFSFSIKLNIRMDKVYLKVDMKQNSVGPSYF